MGRFPTAVGALCVALLGAPAAPGLIIDDFELGDFNVTDDTVTGAAAFGEQSGLATSSVVGGVRLVRASAGGSVGFATASLTTTPADDAAVLGVAGVSPTGNFDFIYDGVANGVLDGSQVPGVPGGGALNLDLSSATFIEVDTLGVAAAATVRLSLWSPGFAVVEHQTLPFASGTLAFSLDDFTTVDLTDVRAIRLSVFDLTLLDAPTLVEIRAIPEPGTGWLATGGLLVLAGRRRAR